MSSLKHWGSYVSGGINTRGLQLFHLYRVVGIKHKAIISELQNSLCSVNLLATNQFCITMTSHTRWFFFTDYSNNPGSVLLLRTQLYHFNSAFESSNMLPSVELDEREMICARPEAALGRQISELVTGMIMPIIPLNVDIANTSVKSSKNEWPPCTLWTSSTVTLCI